MKPLDVRVASSSRLAALCGVFLFGIASFAFGDEPTKLFEFHDVGVTFALPTNWVAANAADLKKANDAADSREPNRIFSYVAALNNAPPPPGRFLSSDYILIQRTPGSITPDEILRNYPMIKKFGEDSQKHVQDYVKDVEINRPYFDSQLNLVVLPHQSKMFDGSTLYVRYYLIMTKTAVIGVNVYAHQDSKERIFNEVETGLKQVRVQQEFQMEESWLPRLKKLIDGHAN